MPVTIEFTGESMNDVLDQIRTGLLDEAEAQPGLPQPSPESILDAMSLQELLLYTSQRAEAEGYDMEVTRPLATARKEDARAKLRGDLEASVKLTEQQEKNLKAVRDVAFEDADEEAEKPKPKKAKAKANGKESTADLKKRCIAALQKLYSDGRKDEVNKILADFGDGAKNFNVIPDEQFGPINEALEALTP
jgi:hypothetical protein